MTRTLSQKMVAIGHNTSTDIVWVMVIFLLPLVSLVTGLCEQHHGDDNGLYNIHCSCSNPNEDLEVTPELSMGFINASSLEITRCRNVIMHSNLFRRAYELHSIKISELDKLSLDPALSLPVALRSLSLSEIGHLDHFPVPGPSSALLHSVKSLELLSFEDITITPPPNTSTSSFIDMPITKIYMKGVKFSGAIPSGTLKFNTTSLVHFSAVKCHFGEMVEGSFYVHASGNVTINNCEFKSMERESMKVYGQCVSLNNNKFQNLGGTHTISIQGTLHVSVIKNSFQTLGAPHALLLNADRNAFVYIRGNLLPCGCYAENFIPAVPKTNNHSGCGADDSIVCALEEKQFCLHHDGKNESIQIFRPDIPSCLDPEAVPLSGTAREGQILAMSICVFMVMSMV